MRKYLFVIAGLLICALSFNLFMVPYNILPGGICGISLIVNNYVHINKPLFILCVSGVLLLISFIFLGWNNTKNSILGSILFPLFVYLTGILFKYFPININNIMLSIIFGGILFGFGLGIIYREGFNIGGTNIINQIISKYFHISMGYGLLITEAIIVVTSMFALGINNMLYSIITVYLSTVVIDRVMIGISQKKSFYIITNKPEDVSKFIMNDLKHGVTILDGRGAYSNEHKSMLLTVIPTNDYYKLREYLEKIDDKAFFVVSDSYEARGGE